MKNQIERAEPSRGAPQAAHGSECQEALQEIGKLADAAIQQAERT